MKYVFGLISLVMMLSVSTVAQAKTSLSCELDRVYDGGDFESENDFSFEDHKYLFITWENSEIVKIQIGAMDYGVENIVSYDPSNEKGEEVLIFSSALDGLGTMYTATLSAGRKYVLIQNISETPARDVVEFSLCQY